MNDSEKPSTPPTAPAAVPPAQPAVPLTPAGVPAPVGQTPAAPAPAAPHGSNQTLIIILAAVGSVVLLAVLLALFWFTLWSPKAQSKRTSTSFMNAITTGDVTKAVDLSGDASSKDFLESAAKNVHGSYKLAASVYQNGKGYYLYTLTGAEKDYARTTVTNKQVASFVYSDSKLNVIPGASEDTSSKPSTSTPTTTTTACLVKSDYDAFGFTNTINFTVTAPKTGNVHFTKDSLQYLDNTQTTLLEPLVDFYKATSTKDYTIHLYGSVATTAASDKAFANQRAEKVKADLIAAGIPASKFVIDAPKNATDSGSTGTDIEAQIDRVVVWSIIPGCTGSSSSSSSNSTTPSSVR